MGTWIANDRRRSAEFRDIPTGDGPIGGRLRCQNRVRKNAHSSASWRSQTSNSPKRLYSIPSRQKAVGAAMISIADFVDWYRSEPRLAFNPSVVLRYRIFLEQKRYAATTNNLRLAAVLHNPQVAFYGTLSTVATLEFLQHHSSEMGHRDPLVTQNTATVSRQPPPLPTRSVRRASGFRSNAAAFTNLS
jgi:hypothetical protein